MNYLEADLVTGFAKSTVNCQLGFFLKAVDRESSGLWYWPKHGGRKTELSVTARPIPEQE